MCWVALDRGAKLAERQGEKSYAQQWRNIAEEIKADILAHGVDSAECSPSATAATRWTPRCCWWC